MRESGTTRGTGTPSSTEAEALVEQLTRDLASDVGRDPRHGFILQPKMAHLGRLMFDYLHLVDDLGWFCVIEVGNESQFYRYGGLAEIEQVWKRLIAVVDELLPPQSYVGRIDVGVAIHAWGRESVAAMPAVLDRIVAALARMPVRELETGRTAHVAIACHVGHVEYPTDTGIVESFAEVARVAGVAAIHGERTQDRTTIHRYSMELEREFRASRDVEQRLDASIRAADFELHFQPQYELATGRIVGVESLARWPGLVDLPGDTASYVALIERHLDIVDFTRASLGKLIDAWSRFRHLIGEGVHVSFNLSQAALAMAPDAVVEMFHAVLDEHDGLAAQLMVEVTESAYASGPDHDAAMAALGAVKAMGVRLSVDDFGSGYGAFGLLLSDLPDMIKIDRSLTAELGLAGPNRDTLRAVVGAIADSGMGLVCEGIETADQRDAIVALGVRYGQGYLLQRPMPEADLVKLLAAEAPAP